MRESERTASDGGKDQLPLAPVAADGRPDMYATTDLRPLLADCGITSSREQVYWLVTGIPERLSLATRAALCDILGCGPGSSFSPSPPPRIRERLRSGAAAPPGACRVLNAQR
jgi:hypothetical protein